VAVASANKPYMMWSRDRAKGRDARIAPLR